MILQANISVEFSLHLSTANLFDLAHFCTSVKLKATRLDVDVST